MHSWHVLTSAPARTIARAKVDSIYIKRRRTSNEISEGVARSRAKMENTIARATRILSTALLISYMPSILLLLFGGAFPIFRTSSYFRWAELLLQMNSLLNPVLYCFFLNRNFRKELLVMMKIRKPDDGQPPVLPDSSPSERRPRRIMPPTAFVEELQEIQEGAQQPDTLNSNEPSDADRPMLYTMNNHGKVKRAMSCRARIGANGFFEEQQKLQEDVQQPDCVNRTMSWDSINLSNTVYQEPSRATCQPSSEG